MEVTYEAIPEKVFGERIATLENLLRVLSNVSGSRTPLPSAVSLCCPPGKNFLPVRDLPRTVLRRYVLVWYHELFVFFSRSYFWRGSPSATMSCLWRRSNETDLKAELYIPRSFFLAFSYCRTSPSAHPRTQLLPRLQRSIPALLFTLPPLYPVWAPRSRDF